MVDGCCVERLDLPARVLPELVDAGTVRGPLLPGVRRDVGATDDLQVVSVGSHDTASAVVGVPASGDRFAYISSGTWSLVGVELDQPVLTEAARAANFTNEGGVDGTIRLLRNVMGLWLVQESMRTWAETGTPSEPGRPAGRSGPTACAASGSSTRTTRPCCRRVTSRPGSPPCVPPAGSRRPTSRAELVRTILDSLALAYRRSVRMASELSGVEVDVIHVVGGGANNELLCQLTADACGRPVLAGPVEAAAIGNALVAGARARCGGWWAGRSCGR